MKERVRKVFLVLLFFVTVFTTVNLVPAQAQAASSSVIQTIFGNVPLISHAAGGINKKSYTNSKDAYELSLKNNYKVIEIDFSFSSDGKLVCTHSSATAKKYTLEQWKELKINDTYTSMCATDVLNYMVLNPQVYLVCDMKMSNITKGYSALYNEAVALGGSALTSRIIPQIYYQKELTQINTIYKWPTVIFTMYRLGKFNYKTITKYIKKNPQIKIMTIPTARLSKSGIKYVHKHCSAKVFTHTVNTTKAVKKYKKLGVDGFYTDYLTPATYALNFK